MDVFEDKESTESGSLAETESPSMSSGGADGGSGVVPQVMNIAVTMSMEKSLGLAAAGTGAGAGAGAGARAGGGGGGGGDAVVTTGVMNSGSSDLTTSGKKKRGRPRKYDSDGNLRVPYMAAVAGAAMSPPTGFTLTTTPSSSSKRGRGRPPGSGNCQVFASLGEIFANTAATDFTPHVVTVYAGEDVAGKILSFAQNGSRGMCVLSANGSISNVTIRQPGSSGGILTYEGRFEILTLTGSYAISENGGLKSRTGGLSVSLAGPDGRVIGGGVAGLLMAASPIQIVVGSFMPSGYKKHKRKHNPEPRLATVLQGAPVPVSVARPASQAGPENNVCNPTPLSQLLVQSQGEANNSITNKDHPNSASTDTADWNGSAPTPDQRPSPDINLSVPIEQQ